ncbi:hypothetical protein [Nonomuraea jabiensis]|uniref:hypothetical protein n=1 Tax=Nonomuraea jabiensis TaxID=882448 RepID=UPI0036CC0532
MISVILACDDPYRAAESFKRAGWEPVFATPSDSDDRLACVSLGDAQVMLGVDDERFLPAAARDHRGAGVEVYIRLDDGVEKVYEQHQAAGVVTQDLRHAPWGEWAFNAMIEGYRFLIAQEGASGQQP